MGNDILQYVILGALALFLIWLVFAFFTTRGRVTLVTKVPGRLTSAVIIVALLGYAVYARRDEFEQIWLLAGGLILALLGYLMLKTGLGEHGACSGGRFIPYGKMEFFSFERQTDKDVVLRIHTRRRDYAMLVDLGHKEQARAMLAAGGVSELDAASPRRPKGNKA